MLNGHSWDNERWIIRWEWLICEEDGLCRVINIYKTLFRATPGVVYISFVSLFVENKIEIEGPTVVYISFLSLNFFTKGTVAFHKWKATIHFVSVFYPIKKWFHHRVYILCFFSFLSFLSDFLSLSLALCSLFSFGFLLKHEMGGLGLRVESGG